MGEAGVQKDKYGKELTLYLMKCNDCECDVRLSSTGKVNPDELDKLQARMLCTKCLNKKLGIVGK